MISQWSSQTATGFNRPSTSPAGHVGGRFPVDGRPLRLDERPNGRFDDFGRSVFGT
jgi:hypothetical protein